LGPIHDEAKVRLDHFPLGRLVALGDAPAQLELLGRTGYGPGTDLLEVQAREVEGGTAKVSMGSLGADGRSLLTQQFFWGAPVQRRGGATCSSTSALILHHRYGSPRTDRCSAGREVQGSLGLSALLTLFLKRPATDKPGEADRCFADSTNISLVPLVPFLRRGVGPALGRGPGPPPRRERFRLPRRRTRRRRDSAGRNG